MAREQAEADRNTLKFNYETQLRRKNEQIARFQAELDSLLSALHRLQTQPQTTTHTQMQTQTGAHTRAQAYGPTNSYISPAMLSSLAAAPGDVTDSLDLGDLGLGLNFDLGAN